jgi:hypothetical protein
LTPSDSPQRGFFAMLARERLMPAPGLAWRRSAYFGGAIRLSTRRGRLDWIRVEPRRTAALALRWRRLACGDSAFDWRRERLIPHTSGV